MLFRLCARIDQVTRHIAIGAMSLFLALIACTMYEVVARYGFNAPTLWAFDVTFMVNGALFVLTGAYTMQVNGHVRIDILSSQFSFRNQHAINLAAYLFLILPAVGVLSDAAVARAWKAYATSEVELMSAWGPLVWPSYSFLALGMVILFVQSAGEALRNAVGMIENAKPIGER